MMLMMLKPLILLPWRNRFLFARGFSSQLFISRLSFYTTDKELDRLFSPFGEVTEARLVKDSRTGRPKGFGFVTFKDEVQAQKAMKAMDGRIVGGRLILVEMAKKTKEAESHDADS